MQSSVLGNFGVGKIYTKPAQLVFDIVQTSEFVFCNVSKNVLGRMLLLFYEVPILKLSFKLEGGGGDKYVKF